MSKTLAQIFATNPTTTIGNNDLMYLVQSPYTPGTDAAILGSNLKALFVLSTAIIDPAHGGTGVNNGTSTITIGGNLAFSGAFTFTGTLTGITSVTFPTSGTLATTTGTIANATNIGITDDNATNATVFPVWVTANTGFLPAKVSSTKISFNPSTGVLSLATPLNLASGGTNANLTANNGGIVWSNASQLQILAGTATARQMLQSGATATPAWSTSTWPATTTINRILFSSAANTISEITAANNGLLVTSATGVPSILAGPGTTGNILQSNAAAAPSFSTATFPSVGGASGNILISDGTNYIASTSLWPNTVGTSGKVVISNGTANVYSTPTFPNASAASGKIIISDGTNWVASTPTYPNTSASSGKILRSDGTNFIASTPTYPTASPATGTIMIGDGTNYIESTTTYPTSSGWTAFTPTLTLVGGAGNTVPTFASTTARFQTVGNVVHVAVNLTNSAGGTAGAGTGTLNMALPVTAGASNTAAYSAVGFLVDGSLDLVMHAQVGAGSTTAIFLVQTSATAFATVQGASLNDANNRQLQMKFFYEI